jgi:hypothetical protein
MTIIPTSRPLLIVAVSSLPLRHHRRCAFLHSACRQDGTMKFSRPNLSKVWHEDADLSLLVRSRNRAPQRSITDYQRAANSIMLRQSRSTRMRNITTMMRISGAETKTSPRMTE